MYNASVLNKNFCFSNFQKLKKKKQKIDLYRKCDMINDSLNPLSFDILLHHTHTTYIVYTHKMCFILSICLFSLFSDYQTVYIIHVVSSAMDNIDSFSFVCVCVCVPYRKVSPTTTKYDSDV